MIGCGTVLIVAGIVGWEYRAQLAGAYRSVVEGAQPTPADSVGLPVTGEPTSRALRSAQQKRAAIARQGGPAYVVLSADEMASLITLELAPDARRALDSIRVTLSEGRFALQARLNTRIFSRQLLGPLAGMLAPEEPVRIAGPAQYAGIGALAWEPDEFTIRAFPFPAVAIPKLVNRLTGGTDGRVPIPVPVTVGDVRIRPSGVTFYRRVD